MSHDLDQAFALMGHNDAQSARFYQILSETPLFLILEQEADGETLSPRVFDLPDGAIVLAFDSEERLADWAEGALPYALLPGRVIAQQLAPLGIGLGLNFGAVSETILPPEAMEWLTEMLDVAPEAMDARIDAVLPLGPMPPALMTALDMGFAAGLAQAAYLAAVRYQSGGQGHILGFVGATAESALTRAVAERLVFSNLEAGALDVTFVQAGSKLADMLAARGQELPIPTLILPEAPSDRPAPGSDPDRPPILK